MYYRWLKKNFEITAFVSERAGESKIFETPVLLPTETGKAEYDRIVLTAEMRDMESVRSRVVEEYQVALDKVISIDELVIRDDGTNDYVEYTTKRQLEVVREILAATDEEVADYNWMYDRIIRYGLFCFYDKDWDNIPDEYNWAVYGLQQLPEEFAKFCNYLSKFRFEKCAEIGVYRGRSAFVLCAVLARKNKNLSYKMIDIFDRIDDFDEFKKLLPQLEKCIPSTSDDHKGEHYDFVFIDADHSYDASILDYNNVGQYAGFITAFHDIYAHEYDHENGGTVRMWKEVVERTPDKKHVIFSVRPDKWMGIGCVEQDRGKYYIFGAHSRGQTTAVYLNKIYPQWELYGYLVDNDEENPVNIEDAPVIKIAGDVSFDTNARVYIATRSVSHERIFAALREIGFTDIVPVDVSLDNALRNEFVREYFKEGNRSFTKIEELLTGDNKAGGKHDNAAIYVVRSAVDSVLEKAVDLNKCERYIQAGRALTDADLDGCSVFDNTGDNISSMNRQLCELTALYWIWKNAGEDVVGVEHYRRRFILPEGWTELFSVGKADVILPVPLYVRPSLKGNYVLRHDETVWDVMMDKIRNIHGKECAERVASFMEDTGCYSPCNMLIAKKKAYDELCEWLFPVMFAVMEDCGQIRDNYQNRYPGFLSERLISFFFYMNQDKYKVVYADKVFLK